VNVWVTQENETVNVKSAINGDHKRDERDNVKPTFIEPLLFQIGAGRGKVFSAVLVSDLYDMVSPSCGFVTIVMRLIGRSL
jgi:hypothetical protein